MVIAQIPAEQRVLLHNIAWDLYERLLESNPDSSSPRLTYDQGELEAMSPSAEHERLNRAIQLLVSLVAYELGIRISSLGSTTFRRQEIQRGFEPDSCFYVQNLDRVRGKRTIDLRIDPPPDFVVEIDISSPSIPKLPIFAEFGVPEVWRHADGVLQILALLEGQYVPASVSRVLPSVTAAALNELLAESRDLDDTEWIDRIRAWARRIGRS